jgi:pimeloyl-ACP methyl ester carboxylesterase
MNKSFFTILLLVSTIFSCQKEEVLPTSIYNQLQHEGAVMPVYMHGNSESDIAIILVHGGPGESAILKRDAVGLYRLEEEHLVVYYDQRASGISEGNVDAASITLEQYVSDLNAVVELVDEITDVEKIFLVSLDWGASVAVSYLTSATLNPKVKGYIATNPAFNARRTMQASLDTLQFIADQFEAVEPGSAIALIDYINQNSSINRFNYETHYRVVEGLFGIEFNQNYVTAPIDLPGYMKRQVNQNLAFVQQNFSIDGSHFLEALDVEALLPEIPVPTKMIWGTHDLLFPAQFATQYQALLGEASAAEQPSFFKESANRPYYEEGNRFYAVVATWVTLFD